MIPRNLVYCIHIFNKYLKLTLIKENAILFPSKILHLVTVTPKPELITKLRSCYMSVKIDRTAVLYLVLKRFLRTNALSRVMCNYY